MIRLGTEVLSFGKREPLTCGLPPVLHWQLVRDVKTTKECTPSSAASDGWSPATVGSIAAAVIIFVGAILTLLALRFRLHLIYVLHVLRANRALRGVSRRRSARCDFDAFVCYSKHDRAWVVGELLPRLEGCTPRYRLCLHERDFPLGALIVQNIVECMERSRRTLIVLTPSFIESQWCQWELELATHRLLEGASNNFLVLVELQRLEARALPRLLRLLVETRTFLQWPSDCGPAGCCGGGAESAEEAAWQRLRAALGPPMARSSARRTVSAQSSCATTTIPTVSKVFPLARDIIPPTLSRCKSGED